MLGAVAGIRALVFHGTSPNGFIVGREAMGAVRAASASAFLPKISFEEVQKLATDRAALFVDARPRKAFDFGHIPDAINLPAHLPEPDAMRMANTLPRDRRLVVYCGDAICSYSYTTAQRLLKAGFGDIAIYSGGWDEWQRRVEQPPRTESP